MSFGYAINGNKNNSGTVAKILEALKVGQGTGLKNHIGKAGTFAMRYGKGKAHRITKHMMRNIQIQTVSDEEVKVLAKALYSGWENARGGDHAFFDMLYNATKQRYSGQVLLGEIQHIFRDKVLETTGLRPS